jgi:ADP-ribosylation factor protein 6
MGGLFTTAWKKVFNTKRNVRILMLGLDAAGKTTIMYKVKMNETVKTIPTVGFNVETMEYKNLSMLMWDIGGQDRIRALWKHYFTGTDALIFVVDSCDITRIEEVKEEICKLLIDDELKGCPLLIYANKQDLGGALNPNTLSEKLEMNNIRDRKWMVQSTIATNGEGLMEGLDWLAVNLKK